MTFTNDDGEAEGELTYNRQDFWATTSNKQLNFGEHIRAKLKTMRPRQWWCLMNVLFEGGAGETIHVAVNDRSAHDSAPTHGIFYAR